MTEQQKDDVGRALSTLGRWAAKNWKVLTLVIIPALAFSWDNLAGRAVSGNAVKAAIISVVTPIVEEQVQIQVRSAKADADTLKSMLREQGELARQANQNNIRRFDKLEFAVARLYRESSRRKEYEREQREHDETERTRRGLFGRNP